MFSIDVSPCCCKLCMLTCLCASCTTIRDQSDPEEIDRIRAAVRFENKRIVPGEPDVKVDMSKIMVGMVSELRHPNQKNWKLNYRIGIPGAQINCCKKSFGRVFGYGPRTVDTVIQSLKKGETIGLSEGRGGAASKELLKGMVTTAAKSGITISRASVALASQPDTALRMQVFAYLDSELRLMADSLPNANNEFFICAHNKRVVFRDYLTVSPCIGIP